MQLDLMIGDSIYDVDDFKQVTQGRPKADMIFYNKSQPVIFVSHKKGSKAADFQQYGGFVADLNIKTLSDTKKYPGVYKFMLQADKVLKTLGVRKTEGLYDLKFTRKGFAQLGLSLIKLMGHCYFDLKRTFPPSSPSPGVEL